MGLMNLPRRFAVVILLIVILSLGISAVFSLTILRYLADGEKGMRRIEFEEFWGRQVPTAVGVGGIGAAVVIFLLRSHRDHSREDIFPLIGVGALGVMVLLISITLFNQLKDRDTRTHRLPSPTHPAEVFSRDRWRALAKQTWHGERPMGPTLEFGPGLKGFPGYVPFEPCLLHRLTFEDMTREQVVRVLGPPFTAVYPDTRFLEYKMIEPDPRGRIAFLLFLFRSTKEGSPVVVGERLYPERITAECDERSDEGPFLPGLRSTGTLTIE